MAAAIDNESISEIYNHYVTSTTISFEEQFVTANEILERMALGTDTALPWVVAESNTNEITGFAYASYWRSRSAYRHTIEVSVYVKPSVIGNGVGTKLYRKLFKELEAGSFRMLIATIALPNDASIAMHEKFGFKKVAHFPQVGFKFSRWIDVGLWQASVDDIS